MPESTQEVKLAIMKDFSCRLSNGHLCLTFGVYISECIGSTQLLPIELAADILKFFELVDIHELNDKPCWAKVYREGINWRIEYIRPCRIKG